MKRIIAIMICLLMMVALIPAAMADNVTVTFETNGGSDVEAQTIAAGECAEKPEDPTKDGSTFVGWYSEETCDTPYDFDTPVTGDITIYAKWDALPVYTVTFNSNGGSAVDPQDVSDGSVATEPSDPTKPGFTFGGWCSDEALQNAYDFSTPVTADITLYAKWDPAPIPPCTVTFDSNGGSAVDKQYVTSGGLASKPTDPTKAGYTFGGWYSDEALQNEYDFNTPVTANITLYAKWNPAPIPTPPCTVTFESNGGSAVEAQTVTVGGKATEPTDPTRAGYKFVGWYSDQKLKNAYDFDTAVTEDITLYAKWKQCKYTVKFDSNGGSEVEKQTVMGGELAVKPTDPTLKYYTFAGWYSDEGLEVAYNFASPVVENLTLYAKWTPMSSKVTASVSSPSNASITSSAAVYVQYQDEYTFTCKVNKTGYYVGRVLVDGKNVGSPTKNSDGTYSYTFKNENPETTHTVQFNIYDAKGVPVTGDVNHPMLWAALMLVSAAACTGLVIFRKRREQ